MNSTASNSSNNGTADDDYDYDWEESSNIFFWDELVLTLVVYGLTLVLGVLGNSLIVFTILRYRRMKSATNVFLASLASADLLLIIVCIPVKVFINIWISENTYTLRSPNTDIYILLCSRMRPLLLWHSLASKCCAI